MGKFNGEDISNNSGMYRENWCSRKVTIVNDGKMKVVEVVVGRASASWHRPTVTSSAYICIDTVIILDGEM